MPRLKRPISLAMLILSALSCAIPGVTSPDAAGAETPAAAQSTETPTPTASLTRTFTPTLVYITPRVPSETPTLTAAPGTFTPTLEFTPTATLSPVVIRVTRPTHCRSGPGTSFDIVGSFLVGMKAAVLGRDATNHFYYIPNPYVYTDYCWVSGKYAEFEGNPLFLPVVTSPPTPTGTGTAAPTLEFQLKKSGLNSCNSKWWVNIEITSESETLFESVKIEMVDKETGKTRVVAADNFAAVVNCDGLTVSDAVGEETAVLVSGPKFEDNIKGHILRAYVTVCAQDGLAGICTTRDISLSP